MSDTTRPNLAASFGAPAASKGAGKDRAAGLEGLLPSRPRRDDKPKPKPKAVQESQPVAEQSEPAVEPMADLLAEASPVRPVAPAPAATTVKRVTAADDTKPRTKPAYVPPAIFDQAQAATKARDITYTDLLVESFDLVSDDELAEAFTAVRPETSGGMPARVRRPRGTGGLQMNLRLDGAQERWLDEKQAAVGAPSRSALVSTVFQLAADRWGSGAN